MYDAMAEEEKTEAADTKLQSEDGKSSIEVKKENGVAKSPAKHAANGSESSASPVNGEEKSTVQKVQVNGVEKSPGAVNGVGESPTRSPGTETATEKKVEGPKEQNGEKTEAKPEEGEDEGSKPEAEEETEGSGCSDTQHSGRAVSTELGCDDFLAKL